MDGGGDVGFVQEIGEGLFDEFSEGAVVGFGFGFGPEKEGIGNIYGCLHMGNHITAGRWVKGREGSGFFRGW